MTTTYLDSARQVIVATDLNAENDKLLKTRTTGDMLGRLVLTEQTEDGTNYTISVKNAYLNMGRVTLASCAMRSTAASTDSWTRVTKDNAGRVIEVSTFGGATQPAWTGTSGVHTGTITTSYDATFTTVTDQAGKVRRSMTDAAGRLRRVDEPNSSGSLGATTAPEQPTSYSYDVFDNLITVTQGSQTRTFTYDSLSRLRTAVNPESGTIAYKYDDNGNLVVKTDARSVSAHFEYDGINRVTRRWYNGSSSVAHTIHNDPQYPIPSSVGTTNEAKFYYDTQTLPAGAPSYSRGSAIGRLVGQTYGTGSNGDYFGYDALGRPTVKIQQTGAFNYEIHAGYNLAGSITSLTYPSGHAISNLYDAAGRLTTFSGNLGDGTNRTYADNMNYSSFGGLTRERFGTDTPIYHKTFYNSRGQLFDTRVSSVNDTWDWNRGRLILYYSSNHLWGQSGTDNNGNVRFAETWIPPENATLDQAQMLIEQAYNYDALNRLTSVTEQKLEMPTWVWEQQLQQSYSYDRWGNRTINAAQTWGTGVNAKQFTVDTTTNRLGVPSGQSGVMSYDTAGNLTNDTYTGAGNRTYDAENKITSALGGNNQAQLYGYDATGQRIKRTVNGVETWQVYGFNGELLAEYPPNGSTPQKEYGYRNGQLLITAESGSSRMNLALATNGATATASSVVSGNYPASSTINGDRRGLNWNNGGGWNDGTVNTHPDWLQIDFNGSKTIDEINVITLQDNPATPAEPTEAMTFTLYGLTGYSVQYWNGSAWVTVTGGTVSGNNKVWKKFTFPAITTTKIRVLTSSSPDAYSRITEVEAWGNGTPPPRTNFALGGLTSASSTISANYPAVSTINGDRRGLNWNNGGGWNDATINTHPDWLQIDFNGSKTIDEINVITLQDNPATPAEPTESMTFTLYGLTGYSVQYWNGSAWTTVPGSSVTGNNKVWRKFTFTAITTTKIRVLTSSSPDAYSRLTEVEAWGPTQTAASGSVKWLVADHLGTPRMILDQTGSLANMKRHDYLPYGEELFPPTGGRSPAMGYSGGDGVRQQFTSYERDLEIGLDFAQARYYSSVQGRFISVDPLHFQKEMVEDPQRFNLYQLSRNNPLKFIDPTGESIQLVGTDEERQRQLAALKESVGANAGAYLYENKIETKDEKGNVIKTEYFVGIYTNGPTGKGSSFESLNEVAGEIAPIVADKQIVKLQVVPEGTPTVDGVVLSHKIHPGTPTGAGVFDTRRMTIYLPIPHPASAAAKEGIEPVQASKMSDRRPGKRTWGGVLAHELGHARAKMTNDRNSNGAALRLENKVRKLNNPNAPIRLVH